MALQYQPNVTVDIYRQFNVADPYPQLGAVPAVGGVKGFLKPHMVPGRFGYHATKLKWTHLLLLSNNVDIRSAYNSWTGGAELTQNADTVIIANYPILGHCTAFYVALVQTQKRGQADEHLSVYLDRMLPQLGGCFQPCGSCEALPTQWRLATGNDYTNNTCTQCAVLNNLTTTLTYLPNGTPYPCAGQFGTNSPGCVWQSPCDAVARLCVGGANPGTSKSFWKLWSFNGGDWFLELHDSVVNTVILQFDPILEANFNCLAANTFVNPTWNNNFGFGSDCFSSSPVTISPL